ncbi:MAG TPA: hypothetical protein PKX15_08505 [Bacteroidales bacterium]|jgi:hypothetical protein|nr:hypothetical protein [Bacteroidales bacterium]
MGIKVKIIVKSKPGHPEEKYYCTVPHHPIITAVLIVFFTNRNENKI